MSTLARELDGRLQSLDPQTAAHVERLVRGVLALTETARPSPASAEPKNSDSLLELAALAEPMGALTNEEIDRTIDGW